MTIDFGTDLSCTDDLTETMDEVTGLLVPAQALFRRLTTRQGGLIGEPDYQSMDVRELLSRGLTQQRLRAIPDELRPYALAEEGVDRALVRVRDLDGGKQLEIDISCRTAAGPFSVVMTVGDHAIVSARATVKGAIVDLITEAEANG